MKLLQRSAQLNQQRVLQGIPNPKARDPQWYPMTAVLMEMLKGRAHMPRAGIDGIEFQSEYCMTYTLAGGTTIAAVGSSELYGAGSEFTRVAGKSIYTSNGVRFIATHMHVQYGANAFPTAGELIVGQGPNADNRRILSRPNQIVDLNAIGAVLLDASDTSGSLRGVAPRHSNKTPLIPMIYLGKSADEERIWLCSSGATFDTAAVTMRIVLYGVMMKFNSVTLVDDFDYFMADNSISISG